MFPTHLHHKVIPLNLWTYFLRKYFLIQNKVNQFHSSIQSAQDFHHAGLTTRGGGCLSWTHFLLKKKLLTSSFCFLPLVPQVLVPFSPTPFLLSAFRASPGIESKLQYFCWPDLRLTIPTTTDMDERVVFRKGFNCFSLGLTTTT